MLWLFVVLPRLGRLQDEWQNHFDAGLSLLDAGDLARAGDRFTEAYEMAPTLGARAHAARALASFQLAQVSARSGDAELAHRRCDETLRLVAHRLVDGLDRDEVEQFARSLTP